MRESGERAGALPMEPGGLPAELAAAGGPRLLVVDDSQNIHEDMRIILGNVPDPQADPVLRELKAALFGELPAKVPAPDLRYRIEDAWQGEEAVRMVRDAVQAGDPYAVVFLDVNMPPGMDGIRVAGLLWEEDPHVEVVICTAYSDYTWEQVAALYGHSDHLLFVRKPFDSVSMKQITLSMTTKWQLARENRAHIERLESEVKRRTAELEQTVAQLREEMALRVDKERQLARQAHYDTLTGLLNRYAFYVMVGKLASQPPSDSQNSHALLFVDIDGFKTVNDRYGHDTGDRLLAEISARLRAVAEGQAQRLHEVVSVLASAHPEAAIFRLGGDEFTVLLAPAPRDTIRLVADRVLASLSEPYLLRGKEVRVACSIGISQLRVDAPDFGTLLKHADTAMYKAKEWGNSAVFYDELRGTGWLDPTVLAAELEAAIVAGHFENHYQHVLDTDGQLVGMAAFARWRHERFGQVMPESFLPVADTLGLTALLERSILADACRQAASLTSWEHRSLFVLVHCAASTLLSEDFTGYLRGLRDNTRLEAGRLRLAIEQSFLQKRPDIAQRVLSEVAACGVGLVVEGIVESQSVQGLVRMLPEGSLLQPDNSLMLQAANRHGDRLFLMNLIERILACGAQALVGGIETAAQAALLGALPVLRQGFLYGGPVPFDVYVRELTHIPRDASSLIEQADADGSAGGMA